MRLLWSLLAVVFVFQPVAPGSLTAKAILISSQEDLLLPLDFAPLEIRKPTSTYSWNMTSEEIAFLFTTKLVVEFEPLDLPGQLDILGLTVTINGAYTSQSFADENYSFDAPTQIGMIVDTSSRKIDGTTDIQILFNTEWSFADAGVKILLARLVSFNARPSFGEGSQKVPLLAEWNSYQIEGIPPFSLYFDTIGFLGDATGSNRLQLSIYVEIVGAEAPWFELSVKNDRLYQGDEQKQWISITIDSQGKNWTSLPLILEYHPHRTLDRHKQLRIILKVYGEFEEYIDTDAAEREQLLEEMPRISGIMGGILTMNAIFLPLLYFRSRCLEERKRKSSALILTDERDK
ncbi:MAG: hypothetical protein ACFFB3_10385 [Candidatus Hodarchaeota archaeon]